MGKHPTKALFGFDEKRHIIPRRKRTVLGGLAATEDQAPALSDRLEEAMHIFHFGLFNI